MAAVADMPNTLWAWAQHSLQNHLYENAIFLAERVVAETSNEASKLLLATCYFESGAHNRAEMVLQGSRAPQNRYLLALCHMRSGKIADAQNVLLGSAAPDNDATAQVPNGASGLYLMGMICKQNQQRPRAIKYFTRSLQLNPFLWSSYEALCQLAAPLPDTLKMEDIPMPPQAVGAPGQFGGAGGVCAEAPPSAPAPSGPVSHIIPPSSTPAVGYAAAASATPVRAPNLFTPGVDSGPLSAVMHPGAGVPGSAACVSSADSVQLPSLLARHDLPIHMGRGTPHLPPSTHTHTSPHPPHHHRASCTSPPRHAGVQVRSVSTPNMQTPQLQTPAGNQIPSGVPSPMQATFGVEHLRARWEMPMRRMPPLTPDAPVRNGPGRGI